MSKILAFNVASNCNDTYKMWSVHDELRIKLSVMTLCAEEVGILAILFALKLAAKEGYNYRQILLTTQYIIP